MGICTDQATTFLKRRGYNVVRHPREGINPLDIIGVQGGEAKQLGRVDLLMKHSRHSPPEIKPNYVAADISGQMSSKLSFAIGVNFLSSILHALGGDAGVTAKYDRVRTIQFQFLDVVSDQIVPLALGDYLLDGELNARNLVLEQYVLGHGRLYVITRTVKSNKITVKAEMKDDGAASLDVPAITQGIGGNVKVTASTEGSSTLTYSGSKMLVFGFECFEIGVEEGKLSMMSAKGGVVELADNGNIVSSPAMLAPDGLFDFA
jgi:hypothetical protein